MARQSAVKEFGHTLGDPVWAIWNPVGTCERCIPWVPRMVLESRGSSNMIWMCDAEAWWANHRTNRF